MSIYFEKARELGGMIRESEQSIRLADAKTALADDPEAAEIIAEFKKFEKDTRNSAGQIAIKAEELKKSPAIGRLIAAEEEYHALLDQVTDVLRMTVLGDDALEPGGCGGCKGRGIMGGGNKQYGCYYGKTR